MFLRDTGHEVNPEEIEEKAGEARRKVCSCLALLVGWAAAPMTGLEGTGTGKSKLPWAVNVFTCCSSLESLQREMQNRCPGKTHCSSDAPGQNAKNKTTSFLSVHGNQEQKGKKERL